MSDNGDSNSGMSGSGDTVANDTTLPVPAGEVLELLPSLAGIVLISLVFLVAVCVCKRVKRKKDMKYVHEQQKRRNGSQGSVYFVRGQGIELQSSHPRSSEFVNVLENMNLDAPSQEHLVENVNSSSNDHQTVVDEQDINGPEDHSAMGEEGGGEEREGDEREAEVNTSDEVSYSRRQQFSRRSDTRSSVRGESELEQTRRERVNFNEQFSRQMSARMSSRSDTGALAVRQKGSGNQFSHGKQFTPASAAGGGLPQLDANVIHAVTEDSDYHGESMNRRQNFTIHQVQSPTLSEDNRIPVAGLRVDITTTFGDIPSFKDPELSGEGDGGRLLGLPAPPDIYSSQILNTVESPEETEDDLDMNEECSGLITETNKQSKSLDRIISVHPPTYESDDDEPMGPDPRYSRIIIKSRPQSVEDLDNLYDEPIIIMTPNSEKLLLAPIFDDPGYDQGFKSLGSIAAASNKENKPHLYHTLEPQFITRNGATRMEETGEAGVRIEDERTETGTHVGELSDDYLASGPSSSQLGGNQVMSRSTLALLDFGEEELQDMDPDLLSHLQQEHENYAV